VTTNVKQLNQACKKLSPEILTFLRDFCKTRSIFVKSDNKQLNVLKSKERSIIKIFGEFTS